MPNKDYEPITLILQQAKIKMISATTDIMNEFQIPAIMMDGVVSGVLADLRAQVSANLITDFQINLQKVQKDSKNVGDECG